MQTTLLCDRLWRGAHVNSDRRKNRSESKIVADRYNVITDVSTYANTKITNMYVQRC